MTDSGSVTSTGRWGLDLAPGGLCLVQDLVNTKSIDAAAEPDLLATAAGANRWLDDALAVWSVRTDQPAPKLHLTAEDLPSLRNSRADVAAWLAGAAPSTAAPRTLRVVLKDGRIEYAPASGGADGLAALVEAELLLASHTRVGDRLKTCANPECGACFFDASRNSSRVWHDVKACGNVANLRASRARRRAVATPDGPLPSP